MVLLLPARLALGRLRGPELLVGLEDGVNTKGRQSRPFTPLTRHFCVVRLSPGGFVHQWPASYLRLSEKQVEVLSRRLPSLPGAPCLRFPAAGAQRRLDKSERKVISGR